MEFLLAQDLCLWLYKNSSAVSQLRLYAILIPMLYCDAITDATIKGLGQQKASVRYNILTSAMDVMGLFFLLPRYGMAGYFISFLVTHLLNFILSVRRLFKIVGPVLSFSSIVLTLTGTITTVCLVHTVTTPVYRIAGFLVCYFSLLFLLGAVQKEDVAWLKGLIRKK